MSLFPPAAVVFGDQVTVLKTMLLPSVRTPEGASVVVVSPASAVVPLTASVESDVVPDTASVDALTPASDVVPDTMSDVSVPYAGSCEKLLPISYSPDERSPRTRVTPPRKTLGPVAEAVQVIRKSLRVLRWSRL